MNEITQHAQIRCQQRGIPPVIVEWLLDFGCSTNTSGAEVFYFTKKSKKAIRTYAGRQLLAAFEKYMDSYLVAKDGHVLTVGHRYKPVRGN